VKRPVALVLLVLLALSGCEASSPGAAPTNTQATIQAAVQGTTEAQRPPPTRAPVATATAAVTMLTNEN